MIESLHYNTFDANMLIAAYECEMEAEEKIKNMLKDKEGRLDPAIVAALLPSQKFYYSRPDTKIENKSKITEVEKVDVPEGKSMFFSDDELEKLGKVINERHKKENLILN